jgi:hypothetical protein
MWVALSESGRAAIDAALRANPVSVLARAGASLPSSMWSFDTSIALASLYSSVSDSR